MWQRKQTIYLLLVTICLLTLQALPVLYLRQTGVPVSTAVSGLQGLPDVVYCAFIDNHTGECSYGWWSLLAVISVVVAVMSFVGIFMFSNRKGQMHMCRIGQVLLMLWCALCALVAYLQGQGTVTVQFGMCLPFVSVILLQLAHKGIKHDDELVRSVDRIR